jgi:predicted ATPase
MQQARVIADRFELGASIGSGAMGVVHRAADRLTGEAVAVKLLTAVGPEYTARFEREARILSQLTHPGIVRYVAHGVTSEGNPYIVMEWLDGEDLSKRLRRDSLIPEEAVAMLRRAAAALSTAHARGIVHRDLKPSNLFLVDGRVDELKVLDFGIALNSQRNAEALTKTGMLIGTPGYMAPEQLRGRRVVDARADVFALGCVLFRCLTGDKPFAGEDLVGVSMRTLLEDAPRLRSVRPELSEDIDLLVHEMLSKSPESRPPDAAAVVARIDAIAATRAEEFWKPARAALDVKTQAERRRNNLKPSTTSFHGRELDLHQLHERFADGQWLVTVLGPAGTGKTRLAIRYGELHPELGSVCFCDLTEARDLGEIGGAVGRVLAVPLLKDHTSAEATARLGRELASMGDALLILDNCEQVVSPVAEALTRWRELAPRARFLATSREVLKVRGEWVHELGPLSLPREGEDIGAAEAVRLFVDRARMVRRDYALGEAQAPLVAEIVRQLDGLPLAIELAAARMSVLGEKTILERLQHRFDLLAGGARDASARQRTLHEAIDWSWRLLEPWEQTALTQAAVFRGGFTLEAAEAVLDLSGFVDAPATLDVLQALHDKSLLRSDDSDASERRFDMYESIRAFAEEALAASATNNAANARHTTFYLNRAEVELATLAERDDNEAVRRLAAELENLMAIRRRSRGPDVLRAMLALDPVFGSRGPLDVHLALIDRTLAEAGDREPRLKGRLLFARSRTRWLAGRYAEARADAEQALTVGRAQRDPWLEASAEYRLGYIDFSKKNVDQARDRLSRARNCFRAGGHAWREALLVSFLGSIEIETGHPEQGRRLASEALAIFGRLGDPGGLARALAHLGDSLVTIGRLDEASEVFRELLANLEHLPEATRAEAIACIGTMHHERGELGDASRFYEQALGIMRKVGGHGHGLLSAKLGALFAAEDRLAEARAAFDRATQLLKSGDAPLLLDPLRVHLGHMDLALARECTAMGDAVEAARHHRAAEARLRDVDERAFGMPFAVRLLRRALLSDAPVVAPLVIGPDMRWFQAPGRKKVDISRGPQARRVLGALVRQRLEAPGEPLSVEALLRTAWPGQRFAVQRSAALRVYVMLAKLRTLGLRDVLRSVGDGYMLDPDVVVEETREGGRGPRGP